jgi:hypothetical protein
VQHSVIEAVVTTVTLYSASVRQCCACLAPISATLV